MLSFRGFFTPVVSFLKANNLCIQLKKWSDRRKKTALCAVYPKQNLSKSGKDTCVKNFPYLLRNKAIDFPNQVWAVDITYIPMGKTNMYLTAVIDRRNRFIVGRELLDNLDTATVINAMKQAFSKHGAPQ
jgi:putative transposase